MIDVRAEVLLSKFSDYFRGMIDSVADILTQHFLLISTLFSAGNITFIFSESMQISFDNEKELKILILKITMHTSLKFPLN